MAGLVIMMLTFMVLTCCFYGDENTDGDNSCNGRVGAAGIIMTLTFMVLTCWSLLWCGYWWWQQWEWRGWCNRSRRIAYNNTSTSSPPRSLLCVSSEIWYRGWQGYGRWHTSFFFIFLHEHVHPKNQSKVIDNRIFLNNYTSGSYACNLALRVRTTLYTIYIHRVPTHAI